MWVYLRDPARGTPIPGGETSTYAMKSLDFLALELPNIIVVYRHIQANNLVEVMAVLSI